MITEQEQKYPKIFVKTNIDVVIVVKDKRAEYTKLLADLTTKGLFLGFLGLENDEIYLVDGKIIKVIFSQQKTEVAP